MCGLAGFAGRFDPALLAPMSGAIAHRGPDDAGSKVLRADEGPARVGLAHRRLSILDLSSAGHQPMTVVSPAHGLPEAAPDDARVWLVYNGEIYNFPELRVRLEGRGHRFESRTDSEVLLRLYLDEGPGFLRHLNGIFAFALYDGRPSGRAEGVEAGDVLLARDGLGVKPLYVAALPHGVLFASEIKAILQSRDVPRDLRPTAIHNHLAYLWSPAPETVLAAVDKMEPGEARLLRAGRVARTWTHYTIPYDGTRLAGTEAQLADQLREKVREAVNRQMVSDVPVGAFLSGGLDSSAVVAMMRQAQPDRSLRCYTIGFADTDDTEGNAADLPYARRVADHLGVDLHTLTIDPSSIDQLGRMLYHLDEPQADPAPINALLISEQARADGTTVLLSGAGGDDLFTGYRRHRALAFEQRWAGLPLGVRRPLARAARYLAEGHAPVGLMGHPALRRAAKMFAYADLDADERLASYFWWSGEGVRRALYTPAFREALGGYNTASPLVASLGDIPDEPDRLNRMLYLEARHFLADHNLPYTDKMGMAVGVEVRVPLLDQELVDFAVHLPVALKQKGAVGKSLFKKSMEPLLPHDVIYRPKTGFGAPLRRWMRVELREQVEDVLSAESLRRRGLFDPAAVARLAAQDRAGTVDAAYTLFSIFCLELWCRTFVDSPLPEPLF